jgi:hypothetical protein
MVKDGFENEMQEKIRFWCEQYKREMVGVEALTLGVNRNPSRRGGTFIPSPNAVKPKHGLINVDNSKKTGKRCSAEADNLCFKYAVCAALSRKRVSKKMDGHS